MPRFIVNKKADNKGDHEVHNIDEPCSHMPLNENQVYLGWHLTCKEAVKEAKKTYPTANGCYWCANDCHTG